MKIDAKDLRRATFAALAFSACLAILSFGALRPYMEEPASSRQPAGGELSIQLEPRQPESPDAEGVGPDFQPLAAAITGEEASRGTHDQ